MTHFEIGINDNIPLSDDDDDEEGVLLTGVAPEDYIAHNASNFMTKRECCIVLFIVFAVLVFFLGPIEIVAWLVSVFH